MRRTTDHEEPRRVVQGYNAHVAVRLQLIVGLAVTQETERQASARTDDRDHRPAIGSHSTQLLADAGYCSDRNLAAIADTGIDTYMSTRKQRHGERPGP